MELDLLLFCSLFLFRIFFFFRKKKDNKTNSLLRLLAREKCKYVCIPLIKLWHSYRENSKGWKNFTTKVHKPGTI